MLSMTSRKIMKTTLQPGKNSESLLVSLPEARHIKRRETRPLESDIEKMSELDVKEKEKRDFALIEQLNTLTPLCPVVKKIKVKNKKNSVVPVQ